jgi:hypothetical protein
MPRQSGRAFHSTIEEDHMTNVYRKGSADFTPVNIVKTDTPFVANQPITASNPLPVKFGKRELPNAYVRSEATSDANPRPLAVVDDAKFNPSLPISPTNPWPVKIVLDDSAYNAAKPVSDSNPLPVVLTEPV